jgi:mannose-6-phosphate isomerase-like protein (cupin superfamily)
MNRRLEIHEHCSEGYKPLVETEQWMASLMNFDPKMKISNAVRIERHNRSDELFILLQGRAVFYLVEAGEPLRVVEMQPGKLYNVPKGVWHNTLATQDVRFAIIENTGTNRTDTEERPLTDAERQALLAGIPGWLHDPQP